MEIKKRKTRQPWGNRSKSKPFERTDEKRATDQEFYNSGAWRTLSGLCKEDSPYCEVTRAISGRLVIATVTDHLIRWQVGGAKFDKRNLMNMTKYWHDRKSAMERHRTILIDTKTVDGELIPVNRKDIFEILKLS